MPNYYEVLKIQPSAAPAEVEQALQDQYNQWRRLVTHHDPNIVNQANQSLQVLEQIRTILTNPEKRAVYDAGIGVGATGGLADLDALMRGVPVTPMAPPMVPPMGGPGGPAAVPTAPPQVGLWTCPKCRADNPPMSEHCFKCGTQLLRECPECGGMSSLIASGVCGKCGYTYERASQRRSLKGQMASLSDEKKTLDNSLAQANLINGGGCIWVGGLWYGGMAIGVLMFLQGIGLIFSGSGQAFGGLLYILFGAAVVWFCYRQSRSRAGKKNLKAENIKLLISQKQQQIDQVKTELDRLANRS
jgi:ribosomal protein L40E